MCKLQSGISIKLANGQQINNKFNDILVVGNGFDLFLGLKTKYSDFFNFIILYRVLYKVMISGSFPIKSFLTFLPTEHRSENLKLFNLIAIVDTYLETYVKEGNKRYEQLIRATNTSFFKWLLKLIFVDNYSDLFESIDEGVKSDIIKANFYEDVNNNRNLREILYKIIIKYQSLIRDSLTKAEKSCNSWTDVEQFIEYVVLGSHDLQCKFDLIKYLFHDFKFLKDAPNKSSNIYGSIQSFCNEFSLYLKAAQKTNDISSNKNKWKELLDFKSVSKIISKVYSDSLLARSNNIIDNISFLNLKSIIDFNYTKTTDILVDLYQSNLNSEKNTPFICHINGEIDSNNLIFGYGRNKNIEVSKECYCFEKFTQRVIKNTQFVDFKNLLAGKYNVLIFGHSCSVADRDVINKLLSTDNLGVAVVFCYDIPSLISVSNNLQEILGQDRMETLLDYSEYNKLNSKLNSPLLPEVEKNENNIAHCLKSFHPVLFFCVESKNDEFLKIRNPN